MDQIKDIIISATAIFATAFLGYRKERETDKDGNLCVCYRGLKYSIIASALLIAESALFKQPTSCQANTPTVPLGFISALLCAFSYFHFYRITLKDKLIECRRWPLKPRIYSISELALIVEKNQETTLHFRDGRKLKMNIFLSGQPYFATRLRELQNRHKYRNAR